MITTHVMGISERVATGPLQFGKDWPGVFIRGDEALAMAQMLRLGHVPEELIRLLESCRVDQRIIGKV